MVRNGIVKIGLYRHIGHRHAIRYKIVGVGDEQRIGVVVKGGACIADVLRP